MTSARRLIRLSPSAMREGVSSAVILAGTAAAAAYPMIYYQSLHLVSPLLPKPMNPDQTLVFTIGHVLLLFAACLLCALVGFLYSPRLDLPGFGSWRRDRRFLILCFAAGLFLVPGSYFFLDHNFRARLPAYFPADLSWALAMTLGQTLAPEVIARFGQITIGVYLLRWLRFSGHPWPAVLAVAILGAAGSWISQTRLHLDPGLNSFTLSCLAFAFLSNLLFGEVYLRKGLLAALALRLGLELKYPLYAWLLS
jgi:hypothetical protein